MITLRQLRYFHALGEALHFGRAAEACSVSQPALSMQIKELETELGVTLIERRKNGVQLTSEGREIARRAADILLSARDLQNFAADKGGRSAALCPWGLYRPSLLIFFPWRCQSCSSTIASSI
jgi:LysR family hydrogen peroxide-inducible transcriptional activator